MAESDFCSDLQRGLDLHPCHYYKIPDMPAGRGFQGLRFNITRPYDLYAIADGKFHAMELKQPSGASFALSRLPEHEEMGLLEAVASGGSGWLVVNFHCRPSPTWRKKQATYNRFYPEALDLAFAAPIAKVVWARLHDCYSGLGVAWFEDNAIPLTLRNIYGRRCWDPSLVLGLPRIIDAPRLRSGDLWRLKASELAEHPQITPDPLQMAQDALTKDSLR